MTNKERVEKIKRKYREKHLCTICGNPVGEENRVTCRACRRYSAERTRQARRGRHENGLCVNCAAPMAKWDEHKNCPTCREIFAERMRKRKPGA